MSRAFFKYHSPSWSYARMYTVIWLSSSLVPRLFHEKEPGTDCLHLLHFSWATGYFSTHDHDSDDVIVTGYTWQDQCWRLWTLLTSRCNAWRLVILRRSKSSERYWRTAMHVSWPDSFNFIAIKTAHAYRQSVPGPFLKGLGTRLGFWGAIFCTQQLVFLFWKSYLKKLSTCTPFCCCVSPSMKRASWWSSKERFLANSFTLLCLP